LPAAVAESSRDAIVSKNLDGVITSWNKGAESLFGYTAKEAVGQNIMLIIPPDHRDEERTIVERLTRGEASGSTTSRQSACARTAACSSRLAQQL
jgi:PAS domain S-box-containing protein